MATLRTAGHAVRKSGFCGAHLSVFMPHAGRLSSEMCGVPYEYDAGFKILLLELADGAKNCLARQLPLTAKPGGNSARWSDPALWCHIDRVRQGSLSRRYRVHAFQPSQ